MAEMERKAAGAISGFDLTVPDAPAIRDFYASVIGWRPEAVGMGDYDDYAMVAPTSGEWVAGVCHARGVNADLPPQWLVYIAVDDLEASMQRCIAEGGALLTDIKGDAEARYCVIRDPAGAVLAIMQR